MLGNVYAVSGDDEKAAVDEVVQEATASDKEEVAPVLDPRWRESMQTEVRALRNRGCWRVVPTPSPGRIQHLIGAVPINLSRHFSH